MSRLTRSKTTREDRKTTFRRCFIGFGSEMGDPMEVVIRFVIPTKACGNYHYHHELQKIAGKFIKAGFHADISYSDGTVDITRR